VRPAGRGRCALGSNATATTNDRIPRLGPGIDPTRLTLHPAEGFLLSRIDGVTPWAALRSFGGLTPEEVDRCLERWVNGRHRCS
jgi:hypothetical protein